MNPLLLPFSAVFRLGVGLRHAAYRRGWLKTHHLPKPVVSVGNLTVGGTGKTPLVALVAKFLLSQGWQPGILTRGYGRKGKGEMIVLPPGSRPRPEEVGDEPALLALELPQVPLVVCRSRARGGRQAEEQFGVDVHILDDGFQHLALARTVDLVALDATQPLSNWHLLPAGRQREPAGALARAQMVVLTRTEAATPAAIAALEHLIRRLQPAARIFRSSVELVGWTDGLSGAALPPAGPAGRKAAAFCALGNARAFFSDLRRWGFDLVEEKTFPDHHYYNQAELERLAAEGRKRGAEVLLTSAKDAVKLSALLPLALPVMAAKIEIAVEPRAEFEAALLGYLRDAKYTERHE